MRLLRLLFLGYLALVLAITLWPSPQTTDAPGWAQSVLASAAALGIPLSLPVLEASANVVMFLPFGALGLPQVGVIARRVPRRRPTGWAVMVTTMAGAALSIAIETAQLAIPGRVSTVQDVVLNTTGALLGAGLVAGAMTWWRSHPRRHQGPESGS